MHYKTISELSFALRGKEISPVEVTKHLLDRIDRLDLQLGAYVSVTAERALKQAQQAEDEILSSHWRGPLHGVPIAFKDIIFTDFAPTTAGTRIHQNFRPGYNATVVDRLEKAGAITLGKVKTTEQAYATHHPDVSAPLNPWSADHWSGASSSGSGVSVAAGLAFAALGSDTGGSIRFPSAANGVTGLKPTWGRVSRHGVFELGASLDHIGPLARTAEDAGIILAAMAGADPYDPTTLSDGVPDYQAEASRSLAGLRIGLPRDYATSGVDPEIVGAWEAAAALFQDLGAELHEVSLPGWSEATASWMALCAPETAHAHRATYPSRKEDYGPILRDFIEYGRSVAGAEVAGAHQVRLSFTNQLTNFFNNLDLMLIPATVWRVPTVAQWGDLAQGSNAEFVRFTAPYDLSGSPTLTMPGGFDGDGLPLAVQLVGPRLSEGMLIRAGAAFQRSTTWHLRRPGQIG